MPSASGEINVKRMFLYKHNKRDSECTVRPCFRSPIIAMCRPSMPLPCAAHSLAIVYRSKRAWVGCSFAPSPPLRTGTREPVANSATEPASGWRIAMMSEYPDSTRAVSYKDSPLASAELLMPVVSRTDPPSKLNAVPKLTRVRVLGSKNKLPKIAPRKTSVRFSRRA